MTIGWIIFLVIWTIVFIASIINMGIQSDRENIKYWTSGK